MIANGVGRKATENTPQGSAGEPSPAAVDEKKGNEPPHPLDGLLKHIRELIEYAHFYVEARKDMLRASIRSLIWKAILGVVAAIAGVTIIVVAAVYLMSGIAYGLGWLFGERYALGAAVTGLGVFLGVGAAAYFGIQSLARKARERTIDKYERRQQQQRERFGHSASDRAQQLRQTHRG